jgi:hypothetical protein
MDGYGPRESVRLPVWERTLHESLACWILSPVVIGFARSGVEGTPLVVKGHPRNCIGAGLNDACAEGFE